MSPLMPRTYLQEEFTQQSLPLKKMGLSKFQLKTGSSPLLVVLSRKKKAARQLAKPAKIKDDLL